MDSKDVIIELASMAMADKCGESPHWDAVCAPCDHICDEPDPKKCEEFIKKYIAKVDKNNIKENMESAVAFSEWININGIRADRHMWTYRHDNWTEKYTTQEMYEKFIRQRQENILNGGHNS